MSKAKRTKPPPKSAAEKPPPAPPPRPPPPSPRSPDAQIDESSAESFPASDPPSWTPTRI